MPEHQPQCAHCAELLDLDEDSIAVAMTSRNTALLFHSDCLRDMHTRAYEMDEDTHAQVVQAVHRAMEDVNDA